MKTFLTCAVLACTLLFSGTSAAFAAYPDRSAPAELWISPRAFLPSGFRPNTTSR